MGQLGAAEFAHPAPVAEYLQMRAAPVGDHHRQLLIRLQCDPTADGLAFVPHSALRQVGHSQREIAVAVCPGQQPLAHVRHQQKGGWIVLTAVQIKDAHPPPALTAVEVAGRALDQTAAADGNHLGSGGGFAGFSAGRRMTPAIGLVLRVGQALFQKFDVRLHIRRQRIQVRANRGHRLLHWSN